MKRLIIITIITIITFLGSLHILTNLEDYHNEIITPATTDLSQASVSITKCMNDTGYDVKSLHGTITDYKGVKLELVFVNEIPCNSDGLVNGDKIVLEKSDGLAPSIVSHEAYHWCHRNGFDVDTDLNQYNEESMAYCVGGVTNIIYQLNSK